MVEKRLKRTFFVLEELEQTQFETSGEIEKRQLDMLRGVIHYANTVSNVHFSDCSAIPCPVRGMKAHGATHAQ